MLLSVDSRNTSKYGTILDVCYVGGEHQYVRRPFDPYFFSTRPLSGNRNIMHVMKDLATFEPIKMFKVSFPDTYQLKDNADSDFTTDDDIPYVQRVAIDKGFFYKSPLPQHYAFDIETWHDKIQAVGYYGNDVREYSAGDNERANIEFLNDKIKLTNPDLLDTYWGSYFDVAHLHERANIIHKIKLAWGRKGEVPYIRKHQYHRGPKIGTEQIVKVAGRLHFDVWKEVDLDQTLSGIKDHRLRTVTEWFKLPSTTLIDYDNMDSMSDDDLGKACLSHACATWHLAEMYLQRLYYFADSLGLPLNMLIERTPSHIPNYFYMRDMQRIGFIARANNNERYPQFFNYGKKAFQGAIVKLYNPGIYTRLFKADFKSMYPTIMAVFNLSPETVGLLSVEHANCSGFEIPKFDGDVLTVYDNRVGIIKVRISKDEGITRQHIREWMAQRKIVKDKLKEKPNDPALESWQYGLKVNLNTIYGYHGMRYARYGCAPIAAITTAMGRWWLWETCKFLDGEGVTNIEADTDGDYYVGEDYNKELTERIQALIPEPYDVSFIKIDTDKYDGGIFYEEKGYMLKDGDEILFHGSGLKGRHLPAICDKASMEMAKALFNNEEVSGILWKYRKLGNFPLSDFSMTVELHKEDYEAGSMEAKMIEKARQCGMEVGQGSELRYVKCDDGFIPYPIPRQPYNIDYDYYRKRLADVLARMLGPTRHMGKKTLELIMKTGQGLLH